MYLWIVIATFMVALISYNLSVRPDVDRAYMETRASTIVTKFRVQQNALKDYLSSFILPKDSAESAVPYSSGLTYAGGEFLWDKSHGNSTTIALSAQDVEKYWPWGFEPYPDTFSKVFCFKIVSYDMDQDYAQSCEDVTGDNRCCTDTMSRVYVISFQQIPSRWIAADGKPISDMRAALSKSEGYGYAIGYTVEDDSIASHPVVSGGMGMGTKDGKRVLKYQPVYTALVNDSDYQATCKNKTCLIAIDQIKSREE